MPCVPAVVTHSVEMGRGGGWLAIEKSTARHKPEELEAARILADKGYKVTLKDEAGSEKTVDGYLSTASFEKRTPTDSTVTQLLSNGGASASRPVLLALQRYGISKKNKL